MFLCNFSEFSLLWSISLYLNLCLFSALRSAQIFLPKKGCPWPSLPTKLFPLPLIAKQKYHNLALSIVASVLISLPLWCSLRIKGWKSVVSLSSSLWLLWSIWHDPLIETPSPSFKDGLTHQSGGSVTGWGGKGRKITNPGIRAYLSRMIFTN